MNVILIFSLNIHRYLYGFYIYWISKIIDDAYKKNMCIMINISTAYNISIKDYSTIINVLGSSNRYNMTTMKNI